MQPSEAGGEPDEDEGEVGDTARVYGRNVFLLYHELTKIKWDYDSPLIKGVMTRLKFNDVIDFEIDPANNSEYDVANTLWDLMEGEEKKVIV